ncbi:MAG: M48 family metallopeptidase [Bacteroidetes bacterium]|nr:M48 family metallopeptidase [Bacteroidota bacterium]
MTPLIILYLIIGILLISFLFNIALEILNLRGQRYDIPAEVAGFYTPEKYTTALAYHRERTVFSLIVSGFSLAITLTVLGVGGFGWLDGEVRFFTMSKLPQALLFFGFLAVASDVITIPFQWYSVFVIEEKYGFNKTTVKTFIMDKVKSYVLGAVVGGALLSLLIVLIEKIGSGFWIWFGAAAALFMLLANLFYTSWILPLFNKLSPLPEGELKTAIQTFAQKVSFPLDTIYIMDGSKRSKKANAFFSGIGKKKKIILYDTLIENHSVAELVAVLAHEVGHFKKKHIIFSYVLSLVQIFFTLWVVSLMVFSENVSLALGGTQLAIHLNLVAFVFLFSPVSALAGLLLSLYSRRNEFEADRYAQENDEGEALATALKKLSADSLSELYPHPVYVFFHYSHPPLLNRLDRLK